MRRVSTGDWRINVSRGARPEPWTAPAGWVDLAVRSARAVGAEIAGVDLLPTADGPIVVEVNAVPGWRGLETALGVDIAAEIVAHLTRTA
jgi:ribosomal protein S6--L-glutamate ligase